MDLNEMIVLLSAAVNEATETYLDKGGKDAWEFVETGRVAAVSVLEGTGFFVDATGCVEDESNTALILHIKKSGSPKDNLIKVRFIHNNLSLDNMPSALKQKRPHNFNPNICH